MDTHVAIRDALAEWAKTPMKWGKDDCILAVANIHVQLGLEDLTAEWRGKYRSRKGALRLLAGESLEAKMARMGGIPVPPSVAPSGSFGYVMAPEGPACVIKYGPLWMGRVDYGYMASPSDAVVQAWGPPPCRKQSP